MIKRSVLTLFFCGFTLIAKSQNVSEQTQGSSVEKSIFGIQTGFAGIWVYNEFKMSKQFVLRSELGLDAYNNDDFYPDVGFLLTTVISLEPRWYYNLNGRMDESKRIDNNSGNFFALRTSFHSDDLLIKFGKDSDAQIVNDLSIIPTWGIRRNIGNHFNYEAGIGIGYIHFFSKNAGFAEDMGEAIINLHLRIGYKL